MKGDSGGPVFISGTDGHALVVGIVSKQHYYTDELKGTYQDQVIRNPLGVAVICHAQFIRDTVETAAKRSETESK
jgi:hypothetical protein